MTYEQAKKDFYFIDVYIKVRDKKGKLDIKQVDKSKVPLDANGKISVYNDGSYAFMGFANCRADLIFILDEGETLL